MIMIMKELITLFFTQYLFIRVKFEKRYVVKEFLQCE